MDDSLGRALSDLGDNFGKLVGEHVSLAQAEFKREGQKLLLDLIWAVLGVAWATVGYCILMAALILALAPLVGPPLAAVIVGVLNLGAGAFSLLTVMRKLKQQAMPPMSILEGELRKDNVLVEAAKGHHVSPVPLPATRPIAPHSP